MHKIEISLTRQEAASDLAILPLFSGEQPDKKIGLLPTALKDFKNKSGSAHLAYSADGKRFLLIGLGNKNELTSIKWRSAIHSAINHAIALEAESLSVSLPKLPAGRLESFIELTGFGLIFSSYRFDHYKKEKKDLLLKKIFINTTPSTKLSRALVRGADIALATNHARDLANHPGNIATPTHLAEHAQTIAKTYGIKCKVLGPNEIEKEKLGLLAGVSMGSDQPPRFIILEYHGKKTKKPQPPIVLVGKGLTFDSGGVSIKPADRMEEMKYDMAGGATVLGIIEAAARLKLPVNLVALIPSAENLLSGRAVKPGDILVSHDQTSVEIINTDAEGRLVLADAISYAKKYYDPKLIIDYATLTGAVLFALGDEYTGYFTNTSEYLPRFKKSSESTAEKVWHLPLAEEYKDQLKSMIADIKNLGEKGSAGATTAALFIHHFVGNTPWIHMDNAGTAWTVRPKSYASPGATGWGVYLTIDFLKNL